MQQNLREFLWGMVISHNCKNSVTQLFEPALDIRYCVVQLLITDW
jgi:hypothetical protein